MVILPLLDLKDIRLVMHHGEVCFSERKEMNEHPKDHGEVTQGLRICLGHWADILIGPYRHRCGGWCQSCAFRLGADGEM